jgi:hypothetical protein
MSRQLEDLLERLSTDEAFREKAMADKQTLAEIGWSPQAIAAVEIRTEERDWGCGSVCGCSPHLGAGCSYQNGHYIHDGEIGQL